MDGGRSLTILSLLCVLIVEVVPGLPICNETNKHSCGGENGKRSAVEPRERYEPREKVLPGFVYDDAKIGDDWGEGDYDERGYVAPRKNDFPSSHSSSSSSQRRIRPQEHQGAEYEEQRREWALRQILELLLKKRMMDYEDY